MGKQEKRRYSLRTKMMTTHLLVTFSSLIICAVLFIVSVWLIVGKYMKQDLDFFLTETHSNLKTRVEFMEHVIYQIRGSEELMDYMNSQNHSTADFLGAKEDFHRAVDISNEKNLGTSRTQPMMETIYLYHTNGTMLSTFYYALVASEIAQSDEVMSLMYEQYTKSKQERQVSDYQFYPLTQERGYLAYTLYDNVMVDRGTVLFEIRMDSLEESMKGIENYKNGFWILYEDKGTVLDSKNVPLEPGEIETLFRNYDRGPYTEKFEEGTFRIYQEPLAMNLNLVIGLPENQIVLLMFDSVKSYAVIAAAVTLIGLLVFIVVTFRLTRPIQDVTEKLQMVKGGDFETKLPDYDNREFHEISLVFNEMTAYVNHLINQVYEKQLSIKEMELKFLQTQMNPHFMFNVLNTIALQAKMDHNEDLFKMISSFSRLIQAKIYRDESEKVKISQEMEYVEYYLSLQKFRYGENLEYVIQMEDQELLDFYIPKLCIQLIAENAVVHGIESKIGKGMVRIVLCRNEDTISIDIIDNGVGFDREGCITLPIHYENREDENHNHVGLNNANHIIQMMYGEQYGITIDSIKGEGTTVSILIPCDRGETECETEGNDEK